MIRQICLALALVAGLFAFSPRAAEAAPFPAAAAGLASPADAGVTQVGWYGHRGYGWRHRGYGRPYAFRHRGYGWGYRRHFGPRFGYRHHYGRRFYRY